MFDPWNWGRGITDLRFSTRDTQGPAPKGQNLLGWVSGMCILRKHHKAHIAVSGRRNEWHKQIYQI